jgi:hypothetical protein
MLTVNRLIKEQLYYKNNELSYVLTRFSIVNLVDSSSVVN